MNKNIFTTVQVQSEKTNVFDRTHDHKTSCNMGNLIPVMVEDCFPGMKWNIAHEALVRLAPLVAPMMHRVNVTFHTFFTPYRLVWANSEKYFTLTKVGGTLPAHPFITVQHDGSNFTKQMDYMGIPDPTLGVSTKEENISALAFACANKIYNEYYRDQNLVAEIIDELIDGDNNAFMLELTTLRRRAWMHDYFTAALPTAQKGDPVTIPFAFKDVPVKINKSDGLQYQDPNAWVSGGSTVQPNAQAVLADAPIGLLNPNELYADTSDLLGSANISDLRRAEKLQEWFERLMVGGSRYTETIWSIFNVKSPDARLQRPEYIGGSHTPIVISEVLNTTGDTGATDPLPQGNMAGHGIGVVNSRNGSYFCQEHGCIITFMSITPITAYQQGIPKMFTKIVDPTQYFWPQFQHIGEQPIQNNEIFAYTSTQYEPFGYTPRYAEYKYSPNRVSGEFRSSLDFWHLGRIFATQPALNQAFIECDPDPRVFAVTDPTVDKLFVHVFCKIKLYAPMSVFGTPSF